MKPWTLPGLPTDDGELHFRYRDGRQANDNDEGMDLTTVARFENAWLVSERLPSYPCSNCKRLVTVCSCLIRGCNTCPRCGQR